MVDFIFYPQSQRSCAMNSTNGLLKPAWITRLNSGIIQSVCLEHHVVLQVRIHHLFALVIHSFTAHMPFLV